MRADRRGRITIPDVVFVFAVLLVLSELWPVVWALLNANAGEMRTGTVYLFRLILPFSGLVLLAMIYVKSLAGSGVEP
jgi:hypothetical protein